MDGLSRSLESARQLVQWLDIVETDSNPEHTMHTILEQYMPIEHVPDSPQCRDLACR